MSCLQGKYHKYVIAACAAITVFVSCSDDSLPDPLDMSVTPVQQVYDMEVLQSDKGYVSMRMTAPVMQSFEYTADSVFHSFDLYPEGIHVDAYTEDGALETVVTADMARHETARGADSWMACGNVVVTNVIKQETMVSDTMYWDQAEKIIHTDCFVKITSPKGMLQGYGMKSDERARNTELLHPFDSYGIMADTTVSFKDSPNFIGPKMKN